MKIVQSMELPPDTRSDEITVQTLKCKNCSFDGLGVYEESRRGALNSESFDHRGYYVKTSIIDYITKMIGLCPEPNNPRCNCPAHLALSCADKFGRWSLLDNVPNDGLFKIKIHRA